MADNTIHVNSNILRQPQLFDKLRAVVGDTKAKPLGSQISRLARDLVLYAAWNKAVVVRLNVAEFCKLFGHDTNNLVRKCTPAQLDEMRACSLPEHLIPFYGTSYLGYVLVKMANYNFLWNEREEKSADTSVEPNMILRKISAPVVQRKKGTTVEFIVSEDMVTQNRSQYQTMSVEDYVSLVTPGGYVWDAARRLYMRVLWKRRYWDRPNAVHVGNPSHDTYPQLVAAAGLESVTPLRVQASKLMAMLRKVGEQPSVCMVPQMQAKRGCYYVTWTRYELDTVGGPPNHLVHECGPAPETWGTDPNPPSIDAPDTSWTPSVRPNASLSARAAWASCQKVLRPQVEPGSYKTWFGPVVAAALADNVLTLHVPSYEHYEYLEFHYVDQLREAIHETLGSEGRLEYTLVLAPGMELVD